MSKPRELWWQYMRRVLRDQTRKERLMRELREAAATGGGERPTEYAAGRRLRRWQMVEYDAVCRAVSVTRRLPDGYWRLRLIHLMYWRRGSTLTLPGAAMECHVSDRTAGRWHGEFIRLVASFMGMME